MKTRFLPVMLVITALTPLPYAAQQTMAAPAASAYQGLINVLRPDHYYGMDETFGAPAATAAVDTGFAATLQNGTYKRVGAGSFNADSTLIGTGVNTLPTIGSPMGPTAMNLTGAAAGPGQTDYNSGRVAGQLSAFNPNLSFVPDPATPGFPDFNRVFEANNNAAISLGPNGNAVDKTTTFGDSTTGAITVAGWIRNGQNGAVLYDAGQASGSSASGQDRYFRVGMVSGNNVGLYVLTDGGQGTSLVNGGATAAGVTAAQPGATVNRYDANNMSIGGRFSLGAYPGGGTGIGTADTGAATTGQWYFIIASTSGNTLAERTANIKVWQRYFDSTSNFGSMTGVSNFTPGISNTAPIVQAGSVNAALKGEARIGYFSDAALASTTPTSTNGIGNGIPAANQNIDNEVDEVGIWNRVLQYDEKEALYVTATTPTGGAPTNTTLAGGNWATGANWTGTAALPGTYPLQNKGAAVAPYENAVIASGHTVLASYLGLSNPTTETAGFQTNTYSTTVDAGATLNTGSASTVRSFQDTTINGTVGLNGDSGVLYAKPLGWDTLALFPGDTGIFAGVFRSALSNINNSRAGTAAKPVSGTLPDTREGSPAVLVDMNIPSLASFDVGRHLALGSSSIVNLKNAYGNILGAEGNVTIAAGSTLNVGNTVGSTSDAAAPATGAHLYGIVRADYNAGSGSLAAEEATPGVLTGTFSTVNLPADDSLSRRFSVLYENRQASGVGTVDTVKIGLAQPGDLDFDGNVDFDDAFELTNNYGTPSGANWRAGDFDHNGDVSFNDAFEQVNFYGSLYATTPGVDGDTKLSVFYHASTGVLDIEGPAGLDFKSLQIQSASGILIPGQASWLSLAPGATNFTSNTANVQGFATNTAQGGSFLPEDGFVIGGLLGTQIPKAFLLNDLTISYGVQGQVGTLIGDLIVPEPSSFALVTMGLVGFAAYRRRRVR